MKLGDLVKPTTLGHWAGAYGACSHALLSWRGVLVGGSWAPSPLPPQVPSPALPAQSSHTRGCSLPSPAPQLQQRWAWGGAWSSGRKGHRQGVSTCRWRP